MYYVVYPVLYLFSLLPFRVLHLISDAVYLVLYYIVGYRKEIVLQNLSVAFPEKTEQERLRIAKDFYHRFLDNFIETIKLLSISKKQLDKHFQGNYQLLDELYAKGYKVQVHLGHLFNWEFANASYSANVSDPFLVVVYMPIANKALNRVFMKLRSRFGTRLVAATQFKNEFTPYAREKYALVLVGDQNPGGPDRAYWTPFFGRLTPFVKGPEKGARFNNTAVVMGNILPGKKRGYYTSELQLLTTEPNSLPDGEITREMIRFIENTVKKYPSNYLWSHRRWKWEYDEKYRNQVV